MSVTLSDINNLINDRRRDTTSNSIDLTTDGFRAICGTLNTWNQQHDWEFQVEPILVNYNEGVTYYSLASDFKALYDVRYYKGSRTQEFDFVTQSNFDSETLKTNRIAISTTGQKSKLRIKGIGNKAQIHTATNYNTNGTWTGATAISSVATDSYEAFEQPTSISFNYSGTSGTLTNSTMQAVDVSAYVNRSNLYLNAYLPTVTGLTGIALKWGTDASNYYSATATTDYTGDALVANAWNKLKYAWSSPTTVGTPTNSSIRYLQITITYSGSTTATGFRFCNVFVSENVPLQFEYYSNAMVKNPSTGTKTQVFASSATTTDTPLWSGQWDWVTEAFVDSCMETLFWMTGQYTDKQLADKKISDIVSNLKQRLPSKKRYPATALKFAIN